MGYSLPLGFDEAALEDLANDICKCVTGSALQSLSLDAQDQVVISALAALERLESYGWGPEDTAA